MAKGQDYWSETTNRISNSPELGHVYQRYKEKFSVGGIIDDQGVNRAHMATTIFETAVRLGWTNKKLLRTTLEVDLRLQNPQNGPQIED